MKKGTHSTSRSASRNIATAGDPDESMITVQLEDRGDGLEAEVRICGVICHPPAQGLTCERGEHLQYAQWGCGGDVGNLEPVAVLVEPHALFAAEGGEVPRTQEFVVPVQEASSWTGQPATLIEGFVRNARRMYKNTVWSEEEYGDEAASRCVHRECIFPEGSMVDVHPAGPPGNDTQVRRISARVAVNGTSVLLLESTEHTRVLEVVPAAIAGHETHHEGCQQFKRQSPASLVRAPWSHDGASRRRTSARPSLSPRVVPRPRSGPRGPPSGGGSATSVATTPSQYTVSGSEGPGVEGWMRAKLDTFIAKQGKAHQWPLLEASKTAVEWRGPGNMHLLERAWMCMERELADIEGQVNQGFPTTEGGMRYICFLIQNVLTTNAATEMQAIRTLVCDAAGTGIGVRDHLSIKEALNQLFTRISGKDRCTRGRSVQLSTFSMPQLVTTGTRTEAVWPVRCSREHVAMFVDCHRHRETTGAWEEIQPFIESLFNATRFPTILKGLGLLDVFQEAYESGRTVNSAFWELVTDEVTKALEQTGVAGIRSRFIAWVDSGMPTEDPTAEIKAFALALVYEGFSNPCKSHITAAHIDRMHHVSKPGSQSEQIRGQRQGAAPTGVPRRHRVNHIDEPPPAIAVDPEELERRYGRIDVFRQRNPVEQAEMLIKTHLSHQDEAERSARNNEYCQYHAEQNPDAPKHPLKFCSDFRNPLAKGSMYYQKMLLRERGTDEDVKRQTRLEDAKVARQETARWYSEKEQTQVSVAAQPEGNETDYAMMATDYFTRTCVLLDPDTSWCV